MKRTAFSLGSRRLRLEIIEDENVGFYLIVYEGNNARSIADHLCDTLDAAYRQAEKDYEVSRASWISQEE